MPTLKYKRVLLKLSGEALAGENKTGIDPETVATICREIGTVLEMGVEMALVIGGGNIFRGLSGSAKGMERSSADYMGMLATVLNALAVQDMLEKLGYPTRVLSAITMQEVCEPFIRRRALRHMEKGRVVICAAGTGNPYFTTDTTAALRGMELKCDAIIKATKVDGIYERTPPNFPMPSSTTASPTMKPWRATWASWTPRPLPLCATITCPSSCAACLAATSAAPSPANP